MMISSSDKATDYSKAPLEGKIVSELGGAPSAAPVGGADRTGLADAARCEQHSGPSAALIGSRIKVERGGRGGGGSVFFGGCAHRIKGEPTPARASTTDHISVSGHNTWESDISFNSLKEKHRTKNKKSTTEPAARNQVDVRSELALVFLCLIIQKNYSVHKGGHPELARCVHK
jgi:hypothetical protein